MRLCEIDDFSNQEATIEHLYRVQTARSYECYLFYKHLQKKYPDWEVVIFPMENQPSSQQTTPVHFEKNIMRGAKGILPLDKIIKLVNLFSLMVKAKKEYENAGGEYPVKATA